MRPVIALADTHFSHVNPQYRIDDYPAAQLEKLDFVLHQCLIYDAVLVIAGDVFDRKDAPARLVNSLIDLFKSYQAVVTYVVQGNHDSYFHSSENLFKTQLGTLIASGVVELLGVDDPIFIEDGTYLYGRSWGCDYPVATTSGTNILISHTTVTETTPPAWMTEAVTAKRMLELHPSFDYIVTGDWHEKFVVELGLNTLINPGPLSRMETGKVGYQPSCFIITDQGVKEQMIPIKADVFGEVSLLKDSGGFNQELLKRFEDSMSFENGKPTFRGLVENMLKTETDEEVRTLAREIFDAI